MPVHAVVAGVELSADEPFPERRIARVQRGVPVAVPRQQVGVRPEALGKMFVAESIPDGWVDQIRLTDECRSWTDVLFLLPVNGNLGLARLGSAFKRHNPRIISEPGMCFGNPTSDPFV